MLTAYLQKFRVEIAAYVSKLAEIPTEQALKTIEIPKKEGQADLCVCVPKINQFVKLKGNPASFAQRWAEQVILATILHSSFRIFIVYPNGAPLESFEHWPLFELRHQQNHSGQGIAASRLCGKGGMGPL